MEEIWIVGAGRFGRLALERLGPARPGSRFVVIDPDAANLARVAAPGVAREEAEGVSFLRRRLSEREPAWIIPALPVHLAAEYCVASLAGRGVRRGSVPPEVEGCLPNPQRGDRGDVYVTHARFRCPADCPEPAAACTVTGRARERDMFALLRELDQPSRVSLVLRSEQLGAGIGGYRPEALFRLRDAVAETGGPRLVSTACRCHGVVTALTGE